MTSEDRLIELTRVSDQTEADLFAAFLEDDGIEFQMRRSARTMAPAMPTSQTATVFMVFSADEERAKTLLEEYKKMQAASIPPEDPDGSDNY